MTDLHPGDAVLVRGHVDEQKYIPQSWVAVSSVRANFFAGEEDVIPLAAVLALIQAAWTVVEGLGGEEAIHDLEQKLLQPPIAALDAEKAPTTHEGVVGAGGEVVSQT